MSSSACEAFVNNLDAEKGNKYYDCFKTIVCDARKPEVLRSLINMAGPEMKEIFKNSVREFFKEEPEDTDEFWSSFPDKDCPQPENERRSFVKDFVTAAGAIYEEKCEDPENEECKMLNEAIAEVERVQAEYHQNGVCGDSGKAQPHQKQMPNFG